MEMIQKNLKKLKFGTSRMARNYLKLIQLIRKYSLFVPTNLDVSHSPMLQSIQENIFSTTQRNKFTNL